MSQRSPQSGKDRTGEREREPLEQRKPLTEADPYNRVMPRKEPTGGKRLLDDMRRLSEDIKQASSWVAPPKIGAHKLMEKMEDLRVELEPLLQQVRELTRCVPDRGDRHADELLTQLKESAFHLEDALDYLVPDPLSTQDD
jgi:hypothetical protein